MLWNISCLVPVGIVVKGIEDDQNQHETRLLLLFAQTKYNDLSLQFCVMVQEETKIWSLGFFLDHFSQVTPEVPLPEACMGI